MSFVENMVIYIYAGKVPVHAIKAYKGRRGVAPLHSFVIMVLEEGESIEICVNKYRPTHTIHYTPQESS
jgi:hypothetical protein